MFTGIIEAIGTVTDIARHADGSAVLTIDAGDIVADLPRGGSLAVNGVCLTAVPANAVPVPAGEAAPATAGPAPTAAAGAGDAAAGHPLDEPLAAGRQDSGAFTADVMGETLRLTSLGKLAPGDPVNLERCLSPAGRFDGHIVQGHVDGTGTLLAIADHGSWAGYRFSVPDGLAPYTALKGSIAIDGVSLTISGASEPAASSHWVEVSLIPATRAHTILGTARTGQVVNIEVDVFAKYAERLAGFRTRAASPAPTPAAPTPGTATPTASTEGVLA